MGRQRKSNARYGQDAFGKGQGITLCIHEQASRYVIKKCPHKLKSGYVYTKAINITHNPLEHTAINQRNQG